MRRTILKLLVLIVTILYCVNALKYSDKPALTKKQTLDILSSPQFKQQLAFFQKIWMAAKEWNKNSGIGDDSFECAMCGIVINEIEGFLIENLTLTEIEDAVRTDICDNLSGFLKDACDDLVPVIPVILSRVENIWDVGKVCVDFGLCSVPFKNRTDPENLSTYVINLDLPPEQRWVHVCSNETFITYVRKLIDTVDALLPENGTDLNAVGEGVSLFLPTEYVEEIKGCAATMNIGYGWATLLNIAYEISNGCTSILAQTEDGHILHARNMDFFAGMEFSNILKQVVFIADFQKNGTTLFKSTSYAGYVGVLSGMKEGAFSITIDTHFYPGGITQIFNEIIYALEFTNSSAVAFLSRDTLTTTTNWKDAVARLSNTQLVTDVFYIVGGVNSGEGAVITRNKYNATNVWYLDASVGRWWILETNYEHWKPVPWYDDRRGPANAGMKAMGRPNLSLDGMFKVLSTKPVLNIQTIYTFTAVPYNGTYNTVARYCPYPCTE